MKETYSKPELVELGDVRDVTAANSRANRVDLQFGTPVTPGVTIIIGSA